MRGAIAAGHELTAEAAIRVFQAGGNAFDAALAALCAACVAEPVLTSLGGGGFLLGRHEDGRTSLLDFFVQTPKRARTDDQIDFHPVLADFGGAHQEFHVGMGSVATPGMVRGLFEIHRRFGSLPMQVIVEPAIQFARDGIPLNPLQAYIFQVVAPIYRFSPSARRVYCDDGEHLPGPGERFRQPLLADTLEHLSREGDGLFYEGELGRTLVEQQREGGGHLGMDDLRDYQAIARRPLQHGYRDYQLHTNPPPSSGGTLIAFALALLADHPIGSLGFGSAAHLELLSAVMEQTNLARLRHGPALDHGREDMLEHHRQALQGAWLSRRGTTHISVIDERGNAAALSLSNGEGCGHMLGESGIMPNNMLGEEDLNPAGFHRWPPDTRVSSMMAPSIAVGRERIIVTGSGGSNRLRTAILQTLSNLIDFDLPVESAVGAPRIHSERDRINIEPGFPAESLERLIDLHAEHHLWDDLNLFFGGTHSLVFDGKHFAGAGDPRRGGVFRSTHP